VKLGLRSDISLPLSRKSAFAATRRQLILIGWRVP
jgi:hypothetical protein